MKPQNQNQPTNQNVTPGEMPYQAVSSSNTPEGASPSLMSLWVFLGLLAAYILIVFVSLVPGMGVNGPDGGPFEGGYLLLLVTLCYLPIFIVTQISATRAINRVITVKYLTRPKPVFIRLLPLIVLATVLIVVTVLTYYNYVQTNEKLAHCPTCIQHYPFNPAWNIAAAIILMLPYLLIGLKNRSRK